MGSRILVLPWESVSQDPTLHKERVAKLSYMYFPHGFEKGTLTPQIVVPKNLDGASGFALNKV